MACVRCGSPRSGDPCDGGGAGGAAAGGPVEHQQLFCQHPVCQHRPVPTGHPSSHGAGAHDDGEDGRSSEFRRGQIEGRWVQVQEAAGPVQGSLAAEGRHPEAAHGAPAALPRDASGRASSATGPRLLTVDAVPRAGAHRVAGALGCGPPPPPLLPPRRSQCFSFMCNVGCARRGTSHGACTMGGCGKQQGRESSGALRGVDVPL
jgi:hypothetical protein